MPGSTFRDKKIASEAGKKSRRGRSEKILLFESWGKDLLTTGTVRAKKELAKLDGVQYLDYYLKLLEFFKPKLARQELVGEDGNPVTIKLIRGDNNTE